MNQKVKMSAVKYLNIFIIFSLLMTSCSKVDDQLSVLMPELLSQNPVKEQGTIYFDEIGNIKVHFNNLYFKGNPAVTEASFLSVLVYKRGADPFVRCCSPVYACPDQSMNKSCIQGMGFSNDLGFAGDRYYNLNPPRPFNPMADVYMIPVYASGNDGVPSNYQGRYNEFSSNENIVKDRDQYDLYLGFYYNVFNNDGTLRTENPAKEFTKDGQKYTIYEIAAPDIMSPVVRIEARFYSEGYNDPPGTEYPVPDMTTWFKHPGRAELPSYVNKIFIAEVSVSDSTCDTSLAPSGNCSLLKASTASKRDYIMIYNATSQNINLDNWTIRRKTASGSYSAFIEIKQNSCADSGYTAYTSPCIIPGHGFFLLTSHDYTPANGARGDFRNWSDGLANTNNGIALYDNEGRLVDSFCYGDHTSAGCKGTPIANLTSASADSFIRKAASSSTPDADPSTGVLPGGGHRNKGNSYNTNNSSNDFLRVTAKQPRNRHTGGVSVPP